MRSVLLEIAARVSLESELGPKKSFVVGGVTMRLYTGHSDGSWGPPHFSGELKLPSCHDTLYLEVHPQSVIAYVGHRSRGYVVLERDIDKWNPSENIWPDWGRVFGLLRTAIKHVRKSVELAQEMRNVTHVGPYEFVVNANPLVPIFFSRNAKNNTNIAFRVDFIKCRWFIAYNTREFHQVRREEPFDINTIKVSDIVNDLAAFIQEHPIEDKHAHGRVALENESWRKDSFNIGDIEMTLHEVHSDDADADWKSSYFQGSTTYGKNQFDITINVNSDVVDVNTRVSYFRETIDKWSTLKDTWPNYARVRQIATKFIRDIKIIIDKYEEFIECNEILGMPFKHRDEGVICQMFNKENRIHVAITPNYADEIGGVDVWVGQKHIAALDYEALRDKPRDVIKKIENVLRKHGFAGDPHSQIDVILRDTRMNKGARVLRYDVRDSKRALEELKAVLEKYKTVHTVPV